MYEKNKAEKPEETAAGPRHRLGTLSRRGALRGREAVRGSLLGHAPRPPLAAEGLRRIPLLPATVALESATIDGKEAPVYIEGGFFFLLTDRRTGVRSPPQLRRGGHHGRGLERDRVPARASGATTLSLSVPSKEDLDFTVTNAKLKSDKIVGDARMVEATIPATGALAIQWQRKVDETAKKREARVYSEIYTLTSLGDGALRARVTVETRSSSPASSASGTRCPPG